jgi:hypothetical protein
MFRDKFFLSNSSDAFAAAIYLSPLAGSKERICVGAVSVNQYSFHIKTKELSGDLKRFSSLFRVIVQELEAHLECGGTLACFKPTLSGVFIGDLVKGNFESHQEAVHSVLNGCSIS